jgi:hypothetical protein
MRQQCLHNMRPDKAATAQDHTMPGLKHEF